MNISKLIVGGFKSLKEHTEIPIAPITFLFGPNSVGKSVVRDALIELKRRLSVERIDNEFDKALNVFRRITSSNAFAHRLPTEDGLDEPNLLRVTLGCEADNFGPNGSTTMAAQNQWTELGRDLYFGLSGRAIKYLFLDESADWTCGHHLTVDGDFLLGHWSFHAAVDHDTWPELPPRPNKWSRPPEPWGILRVNIEHAAIAAPEFHALMNEVLRVSGGLGPEWSGRLVWLANSTLHIRMDANRRLIQNWADSRPDLYGMPPDLIEETAALEAPLGAFCFAINELIRQLEFSLAQDIEFSHVPGSRSVLTEEQVSSDWFGLASNEYVSRLQAGHTLVDYAKWLGVTAMRSGDLDVTSLDGDDLELPLSDALIAQDDFVNDVLAAHLFSARRYQVKAEVSLRAEKMITPRNSYQSTESAWFMKSTLYLLDGDNRVLNFHQVGSGMSYVLPVLTSLWGAKRSLIEQPELHLHPAAQCEMGDAVIRAFNRGRFSIIETHSEHVLLRLLRRVRQTAEGKKIDRELMCQPEAVVVLYFAAGENGETLVHQVRVSRGGDFMDRWPDGFFEERSKELFDE